MMVVPYELYELYDWGKVPELYGTYKFDILVDNLVVVVVHIGPLTIMKKMIHSLTQFRLLKTVSNRCDISSTRRLD